MRMQDLAPPTSCVTLRKKHLKWTISPRTQPSLCVPLGQVERENDCSACFTERCENETREWMCKSFVGCRGIILMGSPHGGGSPGRAGPGGGE